MGHARSVEGSLRRVDEKRKDQRESRKAGKEKEKRQKEAELKRLKSLKNQEVRLNTITSVIIYRPTTFIVLFASCCNNTINASQFDAPWFSQLQERLRQICEVSGVGEGSLGLGAMDLDEDWDPVKYEVRHHTGNSHRYSYFHC